ncbi:MAG: hypothetical protein J6P79_05445 [Pseudobutyrivibrio sp.]|nr:hypothetical protein [Pseudobutyrivibrio sp.]
MDDYQLQLKQEYTDINTTKEQQSEDYYWNKSEYDQKAETEAEDFAINQTEHEERIKEAEKVAGLGQKKLPEQEVPADVMKQMETEYASIHKGKKLSGKARSKVKKEYLRKQRQSQSARKIVAAQSAAASNMRHFVKNQTYQVTGKDILQGNERKNGSVVALSTMMNGQSMIGATYAMRSLSIDWKTASDEECEKKAIESERIFKVIMDYDLKKLKYSNSDEFLKNLGEKLTMVSLASECDELIRHYREMRDNGRLKNSLSDKFLNEIEARVGALTAISTRVVEKANIMSSSLYSVISEDSIKALSDEELLERVNKYHVASLESGATDEKRKQAEEYYRYYKAIFTLRSLDCSKNKSQKFGRGDDPEKLLKLNREVVNKKHPPVADQNEKNDLTLSIDKQYSRVLNVHTTELRTRQGNLMYQNSMEGMEYSNLANANNMSFLKTNPALRKREIANYYAKMHRGKKISQKMMDRIESKFQSKFEEAERLSQYSKVFDEFSKRHLENASRFQDAHKDEQGKSTIGQSRQADAYLLLLEDKTMEEKEKCYKAFLDLGNMAAVSKNDESAKLSPEDELKKKEQIKEGLKPLVDYIIGYDVTKLEFTNPSELLVRYNDIGVFLNVAEEMQSVPANLKKLGLLEKENWIEFQARIDMAMELSGIVKNMMAMRASSIYALLDEEDISIHMKAKIILPNDKETIEKSNIPLEEILDANAFHNGSGNADGTPEIIRLIGHNNMLVNLLQTSRFKPGGSMVDAMEEYKEDAKKEWDSK